MKHAATEAAPAPRIQFPEKKEGWIFQVTFRDGDHTHPEYVEVTDTWVALYYEDGAVLVYNHQVIAQVSYIPEHKAAQHKPLVAVPNPVEPTSFPAPQIDLEGGPTAERDLPEELREPNPDDEPTGPITEVRSREDELANPADPTIPGERQPKSIIDITGRLNDSLKKQAD